MNPLASSMFETIFLVGCLGGLCLDPAIRIYNRIVGQSRQLAMPGIVLAIGIAWPAAIFFFAVMNGAERVANFLWPPDSAQSISGLTLRSSLVAAIFVCELIASDALSICWQLPLRFRPALGLALIHLAVIVTVAMCYGLAFVAFNI